MSTSPHRGRLIVLSGPSGVGKDTVIVELLRLHPKLCRPAAFTTRARRPGEEDGRDYSFVDPQTFAAMKADQQFLETAVVHGHDYGTSRARVSGLLGRDEDVLLKIDVQGAAKLRDAGVDALFVFLAPPSREVLLERLHGRETESPEELAIRTRDQEHELAEARWYDHRVVNDDVGRAAREIAGLLAEVPPARS
jgi:guanylate kinase